MPAQKSNTKAWVVFSGQTDLPWLKILKSGYRHCYVLLNDGKHWITIDPLSNTMDITVHGLPLDFDLPLWLKNEGHIIIPAKIHHHDKQAPWMPFSCVEAVKRVLGIHARFMLTPWQLYKHLRTQATAEIFRLQHPREGGDPYGSRLFKQAKACQRDADLLETFNQKGDFAWEA